MKGGKILEIVCVQQVSFKSEEVEKPKNWHNMMHQLFLVAIVRNLSQVNHAPSQMQGVPDVAITCNVRKGLNFIFAPLLCPSQVSRHGGSMWTWDTVREQFYLHQYGPHMPDLNHRNPHVRQEFIVSYFMSLNSNQSRAFTIES